MSAFVFIGDEVSAAGWRLTGMKVITPEPGQEATTVTAILAEATTGLVLLSAGCASRLPVGLLDRFLASLTPATWVVPEVRGLTPPPDLTLKVRARLGMQP
ncbi:MAG: Vacuolar H+transporting two-sector ATPase F subunit [Magnetococcales bacterium]|nr:Vacuolar H+transporting two-sector ATPase F subunit [Magnetococcales bacterium]NGZ04837.1 Vacuolar H+transporting two-sector ATPase F subunit [Magnetococcales bacterium]